jgi:S1-C subfamily serine protease
MTPINSRTQLLLAALVIISTCLPAVAQKSPVAAKPSAEDPLEQFNDTVEAAGATTEVPLLVGDVIRDLNGKPMNTLDTLRSTLRSLPAGAPVTLQIQREGKLIYLSFTLD